MKKIKNIKIFIIVLFINQYFNTYSQVQPYTLFNNYFRNDIGGWVGGDATFSIKLSENKTLWLFGDTFIGKVNSDSSLVEGTKMIRNSAVIQKGDSLYTLYKGNSENPSNFISTPTPNSSWFWPEHGLLENDTLKIFFSEFINTQGSGGFNFKYNSLYLAYFSYPEINLISMSKISYYDSNNVCYGNYILKDNNYTYIYGRKEPNPENHIPYPHIARVDKNNISAKWEFFDGENWVDDPKKTKRISSQPVSQQYSVFKYKDKYVLITQEIWLSDKIFSFTSYSPTGYWGNKKLLYQTPLLFDNFTYNAFAHSQFINNNKLLVSYNSNGDFFQIFKNIEIYRPQFISIPLNLIDTSFNSNNIFNFENNSNFADNIILYQNYPNPVKDYTKFKFDIKDKTFISLKIYDIKGVEIKTYINKTLNPGNHIININLNNLQKGVYIYSINNKKNILIKK